MSSFSILILGGARSGKSRRAQQLAEARRGDLVYIATAQAFDEEMRDRIDRHRADRGPRWRTVEAPFDLAGAIAREGSEGSIVLVDCLTLWASNLLLAGCATAAESSGLVAAIEASPAAIILVSNEVGFGIVPDNALARQFRDYAGLLNQAVAATVDTVELVAAGLPLRLKG